MNHCNECNFYSFYYFWICYCDISASLSMLISSFQQSVSAMCTSFIIFCLFFCSAFITLLEVIKLTFNVYSIKRINLRIFQIIFYYYFYENNSISNNSFNLYLFKRVTFDVMWCLLILINGMQVLEDFIATFWKPQKNYLIQF